MNAISTSHLTRRFGDLTAVNDVSFDVESGEIFGFLGPNGAGKSTTIMMLTTLLRPTSGHARIAGIDVTDNPRGVRHKIGYIQQDISVDEYMTGRENLLLHARLAHMPRDTAERRIDEMLQLVELEQKQHDYVHGYSGGMRKRLDIAGGLIHMPDVLFLDEPTVGLDIQTRRRIWNYIKRIQSEYGITVFLTTHYMEEADSTCDRIGIIDAGKMLIVDSPSAMKSSLGREMISITVRDNCDRMASCIRESMSESISNLRYDTDTQSMTMSTSTGTAESVPRIFDAASDSGIIIDGISVVYPTLDDVFLHYTGHGMRDDEESEFNYKREFARKKRRGG